jgi:hypothetical protein
MTVQRARSHHATSQNRDWVTRRGGLLDGTDAREDLGRARNRKRSILHQLKRTDCRTRHPPCLPAIYQYRKFAAAGGLTSYGGRLADSYRQVGIYTGRILKGEKPERAGRLLQPRHRRHHGFRADSDERQRFRTLCRYDEPRPLAQANTSPRSKVSRA